VIDMKVRVGLLGLAAGASLALVASAANADGYRRGHTHSYGPCCSWTGFYFGGHAGYAWSQVSWDDVSLTAEPVNNDSSGFIGGGQIGYNWQAGAVVLGVEGTFSGAALSDDYQSVVNPAAVTFSTDINSIGTLTGRIGFAGDGWLLYAKGGWATAQVEISGRNTALPDSFSISDRRNGWTVGGGLEYMATRNISLGLEYSYIDLGSESYASTTALGFPFTVTEVDTQIHSVTARVNYRFHREEPRPFK
jgi:outer membrane immunogenic protein